MRGIINNIINFYQLQAKTLSILVANTQKALEQSEKERKADEQAKRIENFVKGLTMNLNNMLTKFYFLKDRKNRRQEQMSDRQVKAITEFAIFVKTLTKNVCSLLKHFRENQSFEEKMDKEIKEMEAHVRCRLKEYDEALNGTNYTLKCRLSKYVSNKVESIYKFFKRKGFVLEETKKAKLDSHQAHRFEDAPIDSIDSCDTRLENIIDVLNINTGGSSSKKSERQIHLDV